MAKKKIAKKTKATSKVTPEDKMRRFEGDVLGDEYDIERLKRLNLYGKTDSCI